MLSVITSLEFLQHYFSEMGHRDLLVTQNLSQTVEQPTLSYLTRSVRRRAATSKRRYRTSADSGPATVKLLTELWDGKQ